jgi:hypothetical protein
MTTLRQIVITSLVVLVLVTSAAACSGPDCLSKGADGSCSDSPSASGAGGPGDGADGGAGTGTGTTSAPLCTVFGKPHVGLGGDDVAAKADGPPSGDRARAKPFTALLTEYGRVLGSDNAPASIANDGPTFGVAADRWYLEPIASAVFVSTAFDVAFEGCLKLTGDIAGGSADAKYAAPPTKETASLECADWTLRFWSRPATPDQIDACVSVATDTTSETYGRPSIDETTRATTPQRRWAYACASVLAATGFLTF